MTSKPAPVRNRIVGKLRKVITPRPHLLAASFAHRVLFPDRVRHQIQITSFGGVGTTFLYQYCMDVGLNIYRNEDCGPWSFDHGVWKHLRHPVGTRLGPKLKTPSGYRVVYLIGDPFNSVISLFRRDFAKWACGRLQCSEMSRAAYQADWDLQSYLKNGKDLFELEDHFNQWVNADAKLPYPILVVKYEQLNEARDQLLDFWEVPHPKRKLFPEIRSRNSSFETLPDTQLEMLHTIYGRLREQICRLPPATLIEN